MTIDNNKKLNFEINIDNEDNLESLGIKRVSIINKNVIVNLSNGQSIFSKFSMDNLESTLNRLNKKLIDKGIKGEIIERLEYYKS